ncbi:MAG: amino acid adenylation domain-containing protein, partial [Gemmatimonadaceae bacterium]
ERLKLAGTAATPIREAFGSTKFDFLLSAAERADGLRIAAEYRTDLFDAATIDRMLRHFSVLLQGALNSPDTPIANLPILTEQERHQTLVEWNDTDATYPHDATIHSLIEAQVRRRPDAIAIEFGDEKLTYREIDRRANHVAWQLVDAGVAPDDRVALCLERAPDLIVCILGVLKAGAAYLPIDPTYPDDRIEFTVQDAGAKLMLVDTDNRARLEALTTTARILNAADVQLAQGSLSATRGDSAPQVHITPDNMAYVIYTSGSTGRPKGVMVEHRNVTRLLHNDRNLFDFNENDVWTIFHSFAFDFSVWEMYGALMFGGRAVIVPRVIAQSPADFLKLLESSGTTVLNQVPSAFYGLMDQAVALKPNLKVRYVIFGGEALKPALLRPWRTTWPTSRLINMFGITETTVHVTYKEIGDAEIDAGLSNIGRPIPTLTAYILDHELQPVPVGVSGEICVGGLGVARGYLNRPELSAERFVRDPFRTNGRLYRSGDLGRLLPNGEIEYLGRLDHQVKLRGHRIELGEIEAALVQHDGVAEAVAIVREDSPGDQRLVAYIVASIVPAPTVAELRDWIRGTLPEVMVPASIVFLDRIPLTSNGKADRKALPVPQGAVASRPYQSPRSTIEHELAQIWERLLAPGRRISAFDDFFDIGGHSLLAIRMLAEVERMRGVRVPLAWLFESSTVEKLAARLNEQMLSVEEPSVVVLQSSGTETPIAFVHGDWTGGGWYVRRLAPKVAPDSPFYVLPTLGADGDSKTWTIESMAARHVSELRKLQPHGPYRVVGFCVGGVVAYEMALQLQDAGEVVDRLVLIDSSPTNAKFRSMASVLRLIPAANDNQRLARQVAVLRRVRWVAGRVEFFNRLPKGTKTSWIFDKVTVTLPRIVRRKLGVAPARVNDAPKVSADAIPTAVPVAVPTPPAGGDDNRDALLHLTQARASSAYIPRNFRGQIDFVFAEGAPGALPRTSPIDRWELLADRVRLHGLPSGHISLITNNLALLSDALKHALTE